MYYVNKLKPVSYAYMRILQAMIKINVNVIDLIELGILEKAYTQGKYLVKYSSQYCFLSLFAFLIFLSLSVIVTFIFYLHIFSQLINL